MIFGVDSTTPEGKELFKKEWDSLCEMAPELFSKDDIVYPHEALKTITEEPHFRRVWDLYRQHIVQLKFSTIVEAGEVTEEEANEANKFLDLKGITSLNLFIYIQLGKLQGFEGHAGYEATKKILDKIGLNGI